MANTINISGFTLNPQEAQTISEFVFQQMIEQPSLTAIHRVWTGVKMKEQIAIVNRLGKSGILDSTCARPVSGAGATVSEKFWEPGNIGDTFINCANDMNGLFKAYFGQINSYAQKFNIEGSDLEKLIIAMVEDAMMKATYRVAWLGDKAVAAAGAATAGLKVAGNAKFYNQIDGLWKQIFAGVTATTIKKVAISENQEDTLALQLTLAAGKAKTYLDSVWKLANPTLQANPNAQFLVTGEVYQNYYDYLMSKGIAYDINLQINGLPVLKYNGRNVINMNTIIDIDLQADFVENTTTNAGYLPNRIVFTAPENTPIATLNDGDLSTVESFWDQVTRQNYTAYGFTLDAKVVDEEQIVVAY